MVAATGILIARKNMKSAIVTIALLASMMLMGQQNRVSTVTRGVVVFGQLERKLAAAPTSAREPLLTDDFEERVCAAPGVPIPREDWLKQQTSTEAKFQGEAVHDLGDTAVYSALRVQGDSREMLVDVWKKADSDWKLAVRYRCPATGKMPRQQQIPKRY